MSGPVRPWLATLGDARFVDCATAKSKLSGLVTGTLTPEEKAETEGHLASCEGCRLEHHLLQAIHGTSGGAAPSSNAPPPSLVEPMSATPPLEPGSAPTFGAPTPPSFSAPEPGLVLEPITPTLSTTPDPEASFADLALESKALPMEPTKPEASAPVERPSLIPPMPSRKAWDFEPVDPPRSSSPPEESITFAEQALHRSSQREGSRAVFRVVLWSGGALAGVALLAVSVWMAMAHRETANDPQALAPPARPRAADSTGVGSTAMKDSLAVAQVPPVPAATQPSATTQAQPGAVPSGVTQSRNAQPGGAQSGVTPGATQPVAAPPAVSRSAPGTGATKSTPKTTPMTTASGAAAKPDAKSLASTTRSQSSNDATETPAAPTPPRRGPPTAEEGFEPVVDGPAADTKSTWPETDFTPAPASKKPVAKKPTLIIEQAPEEARPATPPDEADTSGPIGRLHLATVKAHEDQDLEALRKIKTSWKSYIRTALGQERERSKREYADCLWAIQELSGKDADRKEALTAYREYVLHAPAGGADARSVARMRHLEDILSDSQ